MSGVKRCAACGKENPVSEMKTCMHNQMHRYVCDMKCMDDFYNPPKKPEAQSLEAKVSALEAERDELRAQVEAMRALMAEAVPALQHISDTAQELESFTLAERFRLALQAKP